MDIADAIKQLEQFKGESLTRTINELARHLSNKSVSDVTRINESFHIHSNLMTAALAVKQMSAQIDVLLHASCISYVLPFILDENEIIQSVSLGADNSESDFDLVTDQRIAEFKFILWKVKGNAVREKTLFGDFFKLAREDTHKRKCLYLLNKAIPERFLQGKRDVLKTLDNNEKLRSAFTQKYNQTFTTVGQYYRAHKDSILIVDLTAEIPAFSELVNQITATINTVRVAG